MSALLDKVTSIFNFNIVRMPELVYASPEKTKKFETIAILSIMCLVFIQSYMIYWYSGIQPSDSGMYLEMAQQLVDSNTLYPNSSLTSDSIFLAPGLVNTMAVFLGLTGSIKATLFIINITSCSILLLSCLYIFKKFFPDTIIPYVAVILMCILSTYWSEVCMFRTELLFTAVAYLAVAFALSPKKSSPFIAGFLVVFANSIRPIGVIFVMAILFTLFVSRVSLKKIAYFLSTAAICVMLMGFYSYAVCGVFEFQSSTGGANMLAGANDDADGTLVEIVFEQGKAGYLSKEQRENMTFQDIDAFYRKQAINWIKENPGRYLYLLFAKTFYIYATETYSARVFFNEEKNPTGKEYFVTLYNDIKSGNYSNLVIGDFLTIGTQLYYMAVFVCFLAGLYLSVRLKFWQKLLPLMTIMILGTGVTVLVVGAARYHFPYLPQIFLGASVFLCWLVPAMRHSKP